MIEKSLDLTDVEMSGFLDIKSSEAKIAKLYLYLKKDQLSKDIIEILETNIENDNINVYYVLSIIDTFNLIGREDAIDFVKVVATAEKDYQA